MNHLVLFQRLFLAEILCLSVAAAVAGQAPVSGSATASAGGPGAPIHHGGIGVGSWNTAVEYKDIVITSDTGQVLYRSDFGNESTNGWVVMDGKWSAEGGVLRQSAILPNCRLFLGDKQWANYTVTMRARKTAGEEGFLVYFNWLNRDTWTWFNVGGWTNSLASIDQHVTDRQGPLCERVPQSIETGVWYDVGIVLKGPRIECYLNGKLVQTATYSNAPTANVTASPVPTRKTGEAVSRFLNPTFRGAAGVGTWNTAAEFRNLVVTSNDVVLYRSDFEKEDLNTWQIVGGDWAITNGVLRQTNYDLGCFANIGNTNWSNYTLTVQARKLSGAEGFIATVGALGDNNRVWFNVGSWGNRSVEIYQDTLGRRGALTERIPLSVETGRWYEIRMVVEGARVSCYLDSNLVHSAIANVSISTNALYLGAVPTSDGHLLKFKIGKEEFHAKLPSDRGGPPALELGSLVQVTGTVQPGANADIDLLLNSPADVVLLQRPSWWTWERTLIFGGIFAGVLITAATWIAMISRKNRLLTIAQRELQKANDGLELRVQERTADLAKANVELGHEQALLRTLLDTASDLIYFKDINSRLVRCSDSICKKIGRTHDQIVGKTDFEIFHEKHARQAFADEQEIIRTGRPLIGKLEREGHPDGRTTWVMTTKMAWRNPEGKIIGTFGISHDITGIKEAEAELERAHKQLIDASRAAGMAEVATGVLHNVGNVLNSVNVSASLLIEHSKKSKVELVGRVAALMRDHAADLGEFITNDPKGRRLAPFLWDVSEQLERERAQSITELAGLQANVEHIKEVVAMQQSYAAVAGVETIVTVPELIDDALRLTESGLSREGVKLVKEFDGHLPDLNVDRHKVLQILVNLIRNAQQACAESQQPEKQVTLRANAEAGRIRISVIDNGVGIPAENATRIFRHGFTTRKNGHGFGLHSSALAAKQLGGNLLAHSDGPGAGATFTLELQVGSNANGSVPEVLDQKQAAVEGT